MTVQNGQAVATTEAPVAMASSARAVPMRVPIDSSIHTRAPPPPQQNDCSRLRGISVTWTPGIAPSRSRGGE